MFFDCAFGTQSKRRKALRRDGSDENYGYAPQFPEAFQYHDFQIQRCGRSLCKLSDRDGASE